MEDIHVCILYRMLHLIYDNFKTKISYLIFEIVYKKTFLLEL